MRTLLPLLGLLIAISLGLLILSAPVEADGNCASHYPYKVTDGHSRSHDRDRDGVGCEANPLWPGTSSSSTGSSSTGSTSSLSRSYNRANWGYNSSVARAALGCSSTEHVDHIVALREAYDSGGSTWTSSLKRLFANDQGNMWCLDASLNRSKLDYDLAEWSGGTCEQRKEIARVTVVVKARYALTIDPAEQVAIDIAQAARCATVSGGANSQAATTPTNPQRSREAQADAEVALEFRVAAQRLGDGRIEFAIQYRLPDGTWSERILPSARKMSASGAMGSWLVSSPVTIP